MEMIKTQGLVLRKYNYSENSLLVTFFTETLGKIKTLVKGAKKPKGRFFGKLELCAVVELMVNARPRTDLHLLTDAALIETFDALRTDIEKFAHAMVILEIVESAFEVESPNASFYQDLRRGFGMFAAGPMDLWLPTLMHLKLLHALGLLPSEDSCQECGKLLGGPFVFSFQRGASLCKECSPRRTGEIAGESWQILYLKSVADSSLAHCSSLAISEAQKRRFFAWTRNCLDGVVHKRIRSYDFLSRVGSLPFVRGGQVG